jgi:hypothetical protein
MIQRTALLTATFLTLGFGPLAHADRSSVSAGTLTSVRHSADISFNQLIDESIGEREKIQKNVTPSEVTQDGDIEPQLKKDKIVSRKPAAARTYGRAKAAVPTVAPSVQSTLQLMKKGEGA